MADRGLIANQKRPCACPETQVDSWDGLPVSAERGLTLDILVTRTSVRPKACNQVTRRCKGGGLESPPTNKLHISTPGERKFSQKLMGLEEHATVEVLVELASSSTQYGGERRLLQTTYDPNRRKSEIGRLRMRRCGPTPALTIFVAYAPTSSYEKEEVGAFYMDLEKYYREDHAFYKVIVGDFNAKGERLSEFIITTKTTHGNSQFQKPSSLRWTFCLTDVALVSKFYTGSDHRLLRGRFSLTRREEKPAKFREPDRRAIINWDLFATLAGFWEDSAMDNIDEEYDWLVEHLHDCTKKTEFQNHQGNLELTSELARLCREAIKEDLKERRTEVLAEAAEARKSTRYVRRNFAGRKTSMTALRNPKGTAVASRRGMEKIIYDFYSDLFDSHVHLPPHHLREDGQVIPEVLPSEIRHAIMSVSREYKMPLCLTFIDLKKAFDSVETEAVVEALDNQGVPTQYIKGDTISSKIFTATLENAMRKLEWDDMGVKVDGRQLHHLRFADDIVLIIPSIS
ncbi:hypothetical protein RB195_016424 [Necator americanus]|uniref:Reverse transcriptase domain-containing protein n=1 Tax=Necator americanus TaxID=51031 RepID=A0ABR1C0D9_NECAM